MTPRIPRKLRRGMPTHRIRLAVPEDGGMLARIYRPAVVDHATSFEIDPPGAEEMGRRVTALTTRLPWLVAERADDITGFAYAGPHRERAAYQWCVEVSAYVAPGVQRSGVGRALYTALFGVLVRQGYRNAYAAITRPNDASERFHERLGFTFVGVYRAIGYKLGRWHDVAWYERALAPREADPPSPRSLRDLLPGDVEAALKPTGRG